MNETDLITATINNYTQIFSGYASQFLHWGKWLFNGFGIIAIVWICLWQAFDKKSLTEAMTSFLKEFFTIAFFYTVMINAIPWLSSIVTTTQSMSLQLTHHLVDPASIILQGLTIANKILAPIKNSGLINLSIGSLLVTSAYVITLTAFIAVAINLAITYLITTFFISISALTLAFGTFSFSRTIARRTIDVVISHSFKLLALYLVIDAGSIVFSQISALFSTDKLDSFDIYAWSVAASLLFWQAAKKIPQQTLQLFIDYFQQSHAPHSSSIATGSVTNQSSSTILTIQPIKPIPAHFDKRSI